MDRQGRYSVGFFRKFICVSALWLPILSAQSVAGHRATAQLTKVASFEEKTNKLVDRFNTCGRTLVDSLIELAYEYQVPMAIEYAGREATSSPINLEFHNKSLREMVEAIVKQDQQYRVSFSNGLVDIFSPGAREDRSNLLNKVLKEFSVTEMETREADFQLFCAVAQAAGSQGCAGSLAGGQWEPVRITLHRQNARTYEILNAIVAQNGRAIWTVTASNLASLPQSSGLWYIYPLQGPFKSVVSERLIRMAQ
jgi:hypothetical protein